MNTHVNNSSTVTIEYLAKLRDGKKVISSQDRGPMTFRIGEFNVLPGLNGQILGMKVGESKKFTLTPENAFGDYDPELCLNAPLDKLPTNLQIGMQLADDQKESYWTVIEIDQAGNSATLDGNHLLAGQEVLMEVKVLEIR